MHFWMRRVSARSAAVFPNAPASFSQTGSETGATAVLSLSSRASVKSCLRLIPREAAVLFARRSVVPGISIVVFVGALYHMQISDASE
jgi:hypothetical protein